jgi:hypothetical protein
MAASSWCELGNPRHGECCLFYQYVEYTSGVHLKEYSIEQARLVETGEVRYYVDTDNAPVVEFIRSFVNQYNQLKRGRIYANMFQLAGKELVKKDDKFEAWYDQIARWLRRHMKREPGLGAYLGSEASSWYHDGGEMGRNG